MCSFTKKLQLLGDEVPQIPYWGGPRWGTSVPQTPSLPLCPPNNPVRLTPLAVDVVVQEDPRSLHLDKEGEMIRIKYSRSVMVCRLSDVLTLYEEV